MPVTIRLLLILVFASCRPAGNGDSGTHPVATGRTAQPAVRSLTVQLDSSGHTLAGRFRPPAGFVRVAVPDTSFAYYLRHLPLKPAGSPVLLYDGSRKGNSAAHVAVVDLPIGRKDLHQCADAVIRLRAEYLWQRQAYDKISFHFTNGFRADYSRWRQGERIAVSGNTVRWVAGNNPDTTYRAFWQYLEKVFTYAGTLSLARELQQVPLANLQIGDVFIRGGSPGHAVLVVDLAVDTLSGKKVFLLAQSYMPAQEIHILQNPSDSSLSPWYGDDFGEELLTPEWTFRKNEIKRFVR